MVNIPKLVRAMQLNNRCINDEWLSQKDELSYTKPPGKEGK